MSKKPTIRQRKDGRYEAKFPITRNGKTTYRSLYGPTKAEVKRKIEQQEIEEERIRNPLFETVAEQWEEKHSHEVEYYTADGYRAPLKDLIQAFGNIPIQDITPIQIQAFLNEKARLHYARQTVKLRLVTMNLICNYAVLYQYLTINPCDAVKVPKCKPTKKITSPSAQDIQTVINSVDQPFGLFPFMLYYTGCRRSELLALKYEDIDDGYISINRVVIFENGKPVIRNYTKTQAGMRKIPLVEPVKDALPKDKEGFIFTNSQGKLLTLSELNGAWTRYKRNTGVQFTPHQLRHAFATLCYDAKLNPKAAQTILGHSKISTTLDIYTDIDKEHQEAIRQTLIDYLESQRK